jgi:NADH-quinone oxidoreductase subunit N
MNAEIVNSIFSDFSSLHCEMLMIASICVTLFVSLFTSKKALFLSIFGVFTLTAMFVATKEIIYSQFSIHFFDTILKDVFSNYFKFLFLISSIVVGVLGYYSTEIDRKKMAEFFVFLSAVVLSASFLVSSRNFLMIYLSVEFLSIVSYIMTALNKNRDATASEAALKYIIYGSLSSGIMLFGISYFYGLTGSFEMIAFNSDRLTNITVILMILVGLGFKIALVPFHMWCPDVYDGAPTPVTAMLSVIPKIAGFAVLIRFLHDVLIPSDVPWQAILGILSVMTMTIGNFAAISQTNIKRLFAYSSIAHSGYILMALCTGSKRGMSAALFYMGINVLMNLGSFVIINAVKDSKQSVDLEAFSGLSRTNSILAVSFVVFLFSLIGIPPIAGFVGKFYLLMPVIDSSAFWFYVIALVAVVNYLVSLYYYARIIKVMFFDKQSEQIPKENNFVPRAHMFMVISLATLIVILGVYFKPLLLVVD